MSDFLNFIRKEQKSKMTEEEQLALHKRQKLQEAQYSAEELEDDDEFYEEDDRLVEAHRIPRAPRRSTPAPAPAPAPMPQEPEYDEPYEEPAPVPQRRPRRQPQPATQVVESFHQSQMNPVLSEAYELIEEMKNKMETMFFKYGMTGLERLNECMLDVCDEIMNPPAQKPMHRPMPHYTEPEDFDDEPVVVEKVLPKKKPVVAKQQPVRKPVKKATPVAKPVVASKPKQVVKSEEQILKEKAKEMNAMFENADLSELGNTLVMQSDVQENRGAKRKAEIEARGKALEEKMTKKPKKEQQPEIIPENIEPVEEFEVVPDGSTTLEIEELEENTSLETAELDIPAEENEEK